MKQLLVLTLVAIVAASPSTALAQLCAGPEDNYYVKDFATKSTPNAPNGVYLGAYWRQVTAGYVEMTYYPGNLDSNTDYYAVFESWGTPASGVFPTFSARLNGTQFFSTTVTCTGNATLNISYIKMANLLAFQGNAIRLTFTNPNTQKTRSVQWYRFDVQLWPHTCPPPPNQTC